MRHFTEPQWEFVLAEDQLINLGGTESDQVKTRRQVGGSHYQLAIQPIDYIMDNGLDYMQGNVIKYVTRYKNKNGIDDLRKAAHYIEMMIEREQGLRNWFNEEAGTSDTNI